VCPAQFATQCVANWKGLIELPHESEIGCIEPFAKLLRERLYASSRWEFRSARRQIGFPKQEGRVGRLRKRQLGLGTEVAYETEMAYPFVRDRLTKGFCV
jgi:hypothetical protein